MFRRDEEHQVDPARVPRVPPRRSVGLRSAERRAQGIGPFDISDEAAASCNGLDFGSLRVPMPARAQLQVEQGSGELLRAVHVLVPAGRVSLSALAAPRSEPLWRELAEEIATTLAQDGARVRSEWGLWGREVEASSKGAVSRFIGVDGPRWMLYGVATGPAEGAEELAETLREMMRDTVVNRGDEPLPVKTVLPLWLPEHLEERVEEARAESARATEEDPVVPVEEEPEELAYPGPELHPAEHPADHPADYPADYPAADPAEYPTRYPAEPAYLDHEAVPPPPPREYPAPDAQPHPGYGAPPPYAPAAAGPAMAPPNYRPGPPPIHHRPAPPPAGPPGVPPNFAPPPSSAPPPNSLPPPAGSPPTSPPAPFGSPPAVPSTPAAAAPLTWNGERHGPADAPPAWGDEPAPSGGPGRDEPPPPRRGLPPVTPLDTGGVPPSPAEQTWSLANPVVSAEQVARQPAWAQLSGAPSFWPDEYPGRRQQPREEPSGRDGRARPDPLGAPDRDGWSGQRGWTGSEPGPAYDQPAGESGVNGWSGRAGWPLERPVEDQRMPPPDHRQLPPPPQPAHRDVTDDAFPAPPPARPGRIDSTDALHLALTMDSMVTQDRLPRVERRRRRAAQDGRE